MGSSTLLLLLLLLLLLFLLCARSSAALVLGMLLPGANELLAFIAHGDERARN